MFVNFRLYDPLEGVDYDQDREEIEQAKIKNPELFAAYEKLKGCLMIQKVGQYPSLMDMQSFNIEKYRKVLSKKSISDFTRAVGLYASGIGSGSFLYLRRIMERLFEEAHQSVINDESWDEKAYIDMRFGERVKYLETFGKVIFPSELERVKPHLYGVISKGVHESTDEECIELFPYLKFAIETLLDEQIQQKEHEKKIKELERVINKSVK